MPDRRRLATTLPLALLSVVAAAGAGPACKRTPPPAGEAPQVSAKPAVKQAEAPKPEVLVAFASREDIVRYVRGEKEAMAERRKAEEERRRKEAEELAKALADAGGGRRRSRRSAARPPPAAEPQAAAEAAPAAAPSASAAPAADGEKSESITNTQHADVDEGGIVKVHGEHLVILRRGRLFTVKVGGGALTPVSSADAFGPEVDPSGAWYDEMLVSKDTIVVIGYSYQRGGTEVGLFSIDAAGRIAPRGTYHLRSNDYYSSRNYASRLVGDKLIFYSPLYVTLDEARIDAWMPAVRRWKKGARPEDFATIIEPTKIYRPLSPAESGLALHTVTVCDLSKPEMACSARGVMGPPGRVFYVSGEAVYVWMTPWRSPYAEEPRAPRGLLYRMPLFEGGATGGAPSVLRVSGAPVDQFSFLERDGHLNVLVRAEGSGDAMWRAETTAGDVALLRVPLTSFDRAAESAPKEAYSILPRPKGWTMQNRFVGDYLVYGTGASWGYATPNAGSTAYLRRYAKDDVTHELELGHGVDRIEAMGTDAVVVGSDGKALHFSAVALGAEPALRGRYSREGASQGELRSHGFFYKPSGERQGVFGLPIRGAAEPGYAHLTEGSASILFVRNDDLSFRQLGSLASRAKGAPSDGCKASCVDWYGNARPIFLGGRVFALLGYEIVEGKLADSEINEVRRVSFAPSR